LTPPTIYIVGDDASVRRALKRMISTPGFEVDCFESPSSFLAQGLFNRLECLLLDVQMPEMTGLALQRALADRPSLNKQIASEPGIAEKTVRAHRSRVMANLRAASAADLVRFYQVLSCT